jgi:hypothetical protein
MQAVLIAGFGSGTVVNVVVPSDDPDFVYGGVYDEVVMVEDDVVVGPGFTYDGADFQAPAMVSQGPIRVTKADFQRLLVPAERYAINALRRQILGLTVADYSDPANALLVAAEDVLLAFEQPAEFIELDHPDTYAGLMLFAYLGVLTEARVNEIVAG